MLLLCFGVVIGSCVSDSSSSTAGDLVLWESGDEEREPVSSSSEPAEPATVGEAARELVEGRGACEVDDDCVLTSFQEGCCVQACEAYATSREDLEARQAADQCDPPPCPPPAPCRGPRRSFERAVCAQGTCAAARTP